MVTNEHGIEVMLRWRDLDHQGHVYHATVLTLLDEARTEWLHNALGVASADQYVVARIEIDYLDEIRREDGSILVEFAVFSLGRTSMTTREVLRSPDGRELAHATVTAVMWDRAARRARPISPAERQRAETYVLVAAEEADHA